MYRREITEWAKTLKLWEREPLHNRDAPRSRVQKFVFKWLAAVTF